MPALTIACAEWAARIDPDLGGAVLSLTQSGRDILRPAPAGKDDILCTASFPLVPYANRIAHGRFRFDGQDIELPRNFGDHPHSLHGVGWQVPWETLEVTSATVRLLHRHIGGAAWPWRYRAVQTLALEGGLSATLDLTNEDDRPMPAGLGFHPYFPADAATRLRFHAGETWLSDETQLPTHAEPGGDLDDWRRGAPATGLELVDHCHSGWDGTAVINGLGQATRLMATGATFVHVYSPPDMGFVGIEPVTHMPDAINRPEPPARTGLRILAPGETMMLTMRIDSVESRRSGGQAPSQPQQRRGGDQLA